MPMLQILSKFCKFHGDEDQLRDRLIYGTLNEKLPKDMLEVENLDFAKAPKMSQAAAITVVLSQAVAITAVSCR